MRLGRKRPEPTGSLQADSEPVSVGSFRPVPIRLGRIRRVPTVSIGPDSGTVFVGEVPTTSYADSVGISPERLQQGTCRNPVARIRPEPAGTDRRLTKFAGTGTGTRRK